MEKVEINFLGTGNAVPTIKRNHTSILVRFKDENILVDCGEGTQRQFKVAGISPNRLTRILITHWHGDHILGLPGLLQTLAMSEYNKTLKIYGPKGTKYFVSLIEKLQTNKIKLEVHEVNGKFVDENDFFIESKEMAHSAFANAYSIVMKDKIRLDKAKLKKAKLPNSPLVKNLLAGKDIVVNGKKILAKHLTYKEKGKKVTIILDTAFNQNAINLSKDSNLLICESTFSQEEKEQAKEYKHLTSVDAANIAKKSKSLALVLTHISQRYEHDPSIILDEAKKVFKNTQLVNDFDNILL